MTIREIVERIAELRTEMEALASEDALTDEQEARFAELSEEFDTLDAQRTKLNERNAKVEAVRAAAADERNVIPGSAPDDINTGPVYQRQAGDPFDLSTLRFDASAEELRERALTAVESVRDVDDEAKAEATRKMEQMDDVRGIVPRLVLTTSSDAYRTAFSKAMAGKQNLWTAEEARAVAAVESMRAATGLSQSGLAVPAVVDPTVILTSAGSTNPVRRLARVESITANSWKPLTTAGVTASWDGEIAEVSDDTPTFAQPEITAHKAQAFVQGSIEAVQDWTALSREFGMLLADAKDQLEATAHISGAGDGSNQPFGIITELDGTSSELSPATGETFAVADVYSTIKGVPPRFRGAGSRVAVLANLGTINQIRQFATANNYHAFLTDLGAGQPSQLLGYPLYEASEMDDADDINAAASADNFILLAGDFRQYVIVDRVGMSVEYIPHLFNTSTNLPDGRRGWYAYWRTGAESVVDNAFRVMNIATTA